MLHKHSINIVLDDNEETFIKNLVKYDRETKKLNGSNEKITFGSELQNMFYTELRSLMDLYEKEISPQ